jgi:LuxR family maltose regulon positive regulatory protein
MLDQRASAGAASASSAPLPFVRTKLAPPALLPDTLRRPRLTERLAAALRRRLTLISAPAGYGKTTLLADWLTQSTEHRAEGTGADGDSDALTGAVPSSQFPVPSVAWISLDAADNDTRVFLGYLGAALAQLHPAGRLRAADAVGQGGGAPIETLLADLLNDLAELGEEAVIVLEDYHLITAPEFHHAVAFVIDHLPPRAHLAIVTRADPPIALARLRARGHLAELRAADLSFTAEEAAAYLLETMGLALSRGQIAALIERTEGWPAGLQLTATALRDRADQAAFVESVVGSHRYIVDYLIEDVFERLPPHIQTFLLQTSILDRLCGPLCDAVLGLQQVEARAETWPATAAREGRPDAPFALPASQVDGASYSRLILDALERDNLFLVPLDADRHWYRYHHLFAEVLRDRLIAGAPPEQVATLHRRASAWYAAYGLLTTAVGHALEAGAIDDVVAIVEPVGLAMATRVGEATLRAWLPAIPDATMRARPRLALLRAWLCLVDYDRAGADEWLRVAEAALARVAAGAAEGIGNVANLRGEVCAVRARLATIEGDAPTVIASAAEALQLLQAENLALRTRVAKDLGYAYMARGDLSGAEQAFAEAMVNGFVAGYPYISFMAASDYAYVLAARGQLRAALLACRDTIAQAGRRGELQAPGAALPYLALADICRERHEPAGALPAMAEAGARISPSNTTSFLCLMLVEARVARAQGELAEALTHARRARFIAQQRRLRWATAVLDALEAQLLIAQGDLDAAARLLERAAPEEEPAEFRYFPPAVLFAAEHVAIAPVQLRLARAAGDPAAMGELAAQLEDRVAAADAAGLAWARIKLRTIQALALAGAGHEQPALAVLRRAVELAAPEGYVRVLAEEGPALAPLLAHLADSAPADAAAHARHLLALMTADTPRRASEPLAPPLAPPQPPAAPDAAALPEPISARELAVLHLMADGQSNTEIAAALVIAISTVKSHVNSIFGKLGVATRTQAIARARRLGLI